MGVGGGGAGGGGGGGLVFTFTKKKKPNKPSESAKAEHPAALPSPLGSLFCATPDDEDDDMESTLVFVKSFMIDDVSNTLEATLQDGTTVLDLGPVHRAAEHTADVMIGEYDFGAISLFAHQHIKVRAVAH